MKKANLINVSNKEITFKLDIEENLSKKTKYQLIYDHETLRSIAEDLKRCLLTRENLSNPTDTFSIIGRGKKLIFKINQNIEESLVDEVVNGLITKYIYEKQTILDEEICFGKKFYLKDVPKISNSDFLKSKEYGIPKIDIQEEEDKLILICNIKGIKSDLSNKIDLFKNPEYITNLVKSISKSIQENSETNENDNDKVSIVFEFGKLVINYPKNNNLIHVEESIMKLFDDFKKTDTTTHSCNLFKPEDKIRTISIPEFYINHKDFQLSAYVYLTNDFKKDRNLDKYLKKEFLDEFIEKLANKLLFTIQKYNLFDNVFKEKTIFEFNNNNKVKAIYIGEEVRDIVFKNDKKMLKNILEKEFIDEIEKQI